MNQNFTNKFTSTLSPNMNATSPNNTSQIHIFMGV